MKLSNLKENSVFVIKGCKAIVTSRCPEDRSSGITTVLFSDGSNKDYIWDREDPEVEFKGMGKVTINIEVLS